jgi:hypothetical protein
MIAAAPCGPGARAGCGKGKVMASTLADFVADHASELRAHCVAGLEDASHASRDDERWFEDVLGDLATALRSAAAQPFSLAFGATPKAAQRGALRQRAGHHVTALMRDFGLVSDAVCQCASRSGQAIPTEEVRLLNLWIDGAVAASLDEYLDCQTRAERDARRQQTAMFAIEVGNAATVMRLVFDAAVTSPGGITADVIALLDRSLARIENLVTQHVAEGIVHEHHVQGR